MLLDPPLSQTVTYSRTPSSVTYFMDGPIGCLLHCIRSFIEASAVKTQDFTLSYDSQNLTKVDLT